MGDIPDNEAKWDRLAKAKGYECKRYGTPIPFGEREIYFEHKYCGWCFHQLEKSKEKD